MIWNWWKNRRRARILQQPMPTVWNSLLPAAVSWYSQWDAPIRAKVIDDIRIFIAEKTWEGCNGLEITEPMQVVIAAQAAMMLVGIRDYYFDGIQTILVYPSAFRRESKQGPTVHRDVRVGESWQHGPIVLSWAEIAQSRPGHNVVVHELAHHLDGLDGDMSGNPILANAAAQGEWERVSRAGLEQLRVDLQESRPTLLDLYAATNRAEYFAVACEAFFETPVQLRLRHPDLHACLTGFFHVDPANWQE